MLRPRRSPTRSRICPRRVCAGRRVARPRPRPSAPAGSPVYLWQPGTSTRGLPVDCSGSSRRWLTAPGWCRGPGSGVSPTAQRPQGLDAGAGLAHPHRASEKITSADQVRCMIAPVGVWAWPRVSRGASGAPAYLGARPGARVRRQDGDRGVSTGAAAHSWSAVQPRGPAATGLPGADRGFIGCSGATRSPGGSDDGQAAGARTWSSRLRRVWWQRRASLRAIDSSANWPPRRALTCWK